MYPDLNELRAAVRRALSSRSPETIAGEMGGIAPNTVRTFLDEGKNPSRRTLGIVSTWYHQQQRAAVRIGLVREGAAPAYSTNAELRGRVMEVEALLEFALERQRLLRMALRDPDPA